MLEGTVLRKTLFPALCGCIAFSVALTCHSQGSFGDALKGLGKKIEKSANPSSSPSSAPSQSQSTGNPEQFKPSAPFEFKGYKLGMSYEAFAQDRRFLCSEKVGLFYNRPLRNGGRFKTCFVNDRTFHPDFKTIGGIPITVAVFEFLDDKLANIWIRFRDNSIGGGKNPNDTVVPGLKEKFGNPHVNLRPGLGWKDTAAQQNLLLLPPSGPGDPHTFDLYTVGLQEIEDAYDKEIKDSYQKRQEETKNRARKDL